jgi:ribonuclease BN (tRNA processing enzyme)
MEEMPLSPGRVIISGKPIGQNRKFSVNQKDMKIIFIGVGEATDQKPNTSILIEAKLNLLLDCGYSVPPALWSYSSDPNLLDIIYISHLHADHYFGLAPVLLRMMEGGRTKEITVVCPKGFSKMIGQSLDLAYGEIFQRIKFRILYKEVQEGTTEKIDSFILSFAGTAHLRKNLAVRISAGTKSVCYSGDGRMTETSRRLYENCNLLIHDAYHQNDAPPGKPMFHESIESLMEYQKSAKIEKIALIHIGKNNNLEQLKQFQNESFFIPQAGDRVEL